MDLHPAGSSHSELWATSQGKQVGYVKIGDVDHAGVWNGTADSWVDLHSLLNASYTSSYARGIEVQGNHIWVAGYAYNSTAGRYEAMLWHNVVPEVSSLLTLGSGILSLVGAVRRKRP